MNARKYNEAISAFSKIKTFKDSAARIETCMTNKENDRKDAIFAEALRTVASTSADDKTLKKSIALLQTIKGYKNADERIEELEVRLAKWYENKKIAEEQARIKAEQEKLEAQRQAELRAIKAQRAKRKAKKTAIIGIPSIIILGLIVVLLITLIIPAIRLSVADNKFKAQQYDEARNIYVELDGFFGSEKRIAVIDAISQIEDYSFEFTIRNLLSNGIPVELTYDCEGGSVDLNSTNSTSRSTIRVLSYHENDIESLCNTSNETIIYNESWEFSELKIPYRSGYTFQKWTLKEYSYDVDKKNPNFCVVLSAIWKENVYNISYNLNGGSIVGRNPETFTPESESFTLVNPTRTGYLFAGWTSTDNSKPTMKVTIPKGSYGNKNYTATWMPNKYIITFDSNGGTLSVQTQTVTYNKFESLPTPQKTGYTFIGWYNGNTKYESGTWKTTSNIKLKAQWQLATYNITYILYGGTNNDSNPSCYNMNSQDINLKEPTRSGYTFLGWTFETQNIPIKDVIIHSGTTGNLIFTANWSENPHYAITYSNVSGWTMPTDYIKSAPYGSVVDLTSIVPTTENNYSFLGWTKTKDGTDYLTKFTVGTYNTVYLKYATTDFSATGLPDFVLEDVEGNINRSGNSYIDIPLPGDLANYKGIKTVTATLTYQIRIKRAIAFGFSMFDCYTYAYGGISKTTTTQPVRNLMGEVHNNSTSWTEDYVSRTWKIDLKENETKFRVWAGYLFTSDGKTTVSRSFQANFVSLTYSVKTQAGTTYTLSYDLNKPSESISEDADVLGSKRIITLTRRRLYNNIFGSVPTILIRKSFCKNL